MATLRPASDVPIDIDVHRSCRLAPLAKSQVVRTIRAVLLDERVAAAELSIAIVDDAEIHRVNREHLQHDYPTDVVSFLYSARKSSAKPKSTPVRRGSELIIEGELVVSAETANREAPRHGWTPAEELQLYLIHGALHLCGYDDLTPAERRIMRRREKEILALLPTPTGERGASAP